MLVNWVNEDSNTIGDPCVKMIMDLWDIQEAFPQFGAMFKGSGPRQ